MKDINLNWKYETEMEHKKWLSEIPFISFPSDWQIQISPPFGGAVIRFRVKSGKAHISIYLDCYDNLGYVGEPYWEIYPDENGDNLRFLLNEINELIKAIQDSIDKTNKQEN
jgi:hypothetical protein